MENNSLITISGLRHLRTIYQASNCRISIHYNSRLRDSAVNGILASLIIASIRVTISG